jgi:hypothetical protein
MVLMGIPSLENAPSLCDEVHLLMSFRAAGEAISSLSCAEIEALLRFAAEYSRETRICHAERSDAFRCST